MKKLLIFFLALSIILSTLAGCTAPTPDTQSCLHKDADDNGKCDKCTLSLMVTIDFYAINDLHGKFDDTEENEGVDELTSYLRSRHVYDDHAVFLSSGDMWQGSSESNLTKGLIVTDWMNELGFTSMTLGNHEYDWGEEFIEENDALAEFPFLAINVFDRDTNERVSYCEASTVIERGGIQIGIIGAIGDCYSSISGDKSGGFYIKTDDELTALVKAEAKRLRDDGVDYIVYSIHDGYDSNSSSAQHITAAKLSSYYDSSLSGEYIDLVFEGHTHKGYVLIDNKGVYHLQGGGDNDGISHTEIRINSVTGSSRVTSAEVISEGTYTKSPDDSIVDELLEKYEEQIAAANILLGTNGTYRRANEIKQLTAKLYYEYGIEKWGDEYDIALGGGFISVRSPYNLNAGDVRYADVYSILPFDNNLVLCSVSGYDLRTKFIETTNNNYFVETAPWLAAELDDAKTYYIIVDTYTSTYKPNRLTEIERVSETVFARDLLAEYIKSGGLE